MMISGTKFFDGNEYHLHSLYKTSNAAQIVAREHRRIGCMSMDVELEDTYERTMYAVYDMSF